MKLTAEIDLDDIFSGDHWGTMIGEIVRDELKAAIKIEIKASIRKDPQLKKAVKRLQNLASQRIIEAI